MLKGSTQKSIYRRLENNNFSGTIPKSFCNIFNSLLTCGKNADGLSNNIFACPLPAECSTLLTDTCGAVCTHSSYTSTSSTSYSSETTPIESNLRSELIIVSSTMGTLVVILSVTVVTLATQLCRRNHSYRRQTDEILELGERQKIETK